VEVSIFAVVHRGRIGPSVFHGGANMRIYLTVLAIAFCGMIKGPWWFAIAGGLVLAAMLIQEDTQPNARLASLQTLELLILANVARVSLSAVAATSAYILGQIAAWTFSI
jgi:hypothetical protein